MNGWMDGGEAEIVPLSLGKRSAEIGVDRLPDAHCSYL